MEADLGKLFVGGISWDTNEEHLKEYFRKYGEVVEAVIMKDRVTGRARGFGFVVFADFAVAERVVMEKHTIDGRMVEAKKAVPREDHNIINKNRGNVHGSPVPARTKKIFVGGLPSTVTESDFRKYFEQFGTITDVVVMYDHNTQRPRGFGFITYDSEGAVDKVLVKTFHELNGKKVEVKKAVPKELSSGPTMRSPGGGYNYNLNRVNSLLNGYSQAYNPSLASGYGMRVDARFGPLSNGRGGFSPLNPSRYEMGMNFEIGMSPSHSGNMNFNRLCFGRGMSPFYNGNSTRYSSPIMYGGSNIDAGSDFSSPAYNVWGNGGLSYVRTSATSNVILGSGSEGFGGFGSNGINWGASTAPITTQNGERNSSFATGHLRYSSDENNLGMVSSGFKRSNSTDTGANRTYNGSTDGYDGLYTDLYGSNSIYGDPTWHSSSSKFDNSGPFGYGLESAASDGAAKGSAGYIEGYNVSNRQSNRGIAV